MEVSLPEIEIYDTIFQFDIDNLVFIEKDNSNNLFFFNEMQDHLTHYEFYYSTATKNSPRERPLGPEDDIFNESEKSKEEFANSLVKVKIPRIGELDPVGMMRKYGCTLDDIKNKTDFEIIVDQEVLGRRVGGERVKIDIAGIVYEVDALEHTLKSLNGSGDIIKLLAYRYDYFIEDESCYYLYCNMESGGIVDMLEDQTGKNLIEYKVPDLTDLDPFAVINNLHFLTDLELYYQDLKMFHIAEPTSQLIEASSLYKSDFKVVNPVLETMLLIPEYDPSFAIQEYRDYVIAMRKDSCQLDHDLTVIFEKTNNPYNAQIIVPYSEQSDYNTKLSGINEAMKHIDCVVDNANIATRNALQSSLMPLNKYLELYHSSHQTEAEKLLLNKEKHVAENPKKGKGHKL